MWCVLQPRPHIDNRSSLQIEPIDRSTSQITISPRLKQQSPPTNSHLPSLRLNLHLIRTNQIRFKIPPPLHRRFYPRLAFFKTPLRRAHIACYTSLRFKPFLLVIVVFVSWRKRYRMGVLDRRVLGLVYSSEGSGERGAYLGQEIDLLDL